MNARLTAAFLGASLTVLASAVSAQAAQSAQIATTAAAAAEVGGDDVSLAEIVVTARRRSESLQEVPITVNAVTSEALQKLNLKQFSDIASVVPGLSLVTDPLASNTSASMRGVSFNVSTAAEPTVALYLNDVPVQAGFLFHSMYDVGQVEVLKGPQGTNRGVSAPSGAITFTMHKPDLSDYGGYAETTLTDLQGRNAQGAVNIPIIKDVLAIRVAALIDQNKGDGVTSINSRIQPRSRTTSERFSISFEPSDLFNGTVTYQHLDQANTHFQQVTGPGHAGFTIGAVTYPASPALTVKDRASVEEFPDTFNTRNDIVVAQFDSRIFGQHLSYVGSYMNQKNKIVGGTLHDLGNLLPGVDFKNASNSIYENTTHEIRLASDPSPGRAFDYTVGAFYQYRKERGFFLQDQSLNPGSFGTGATPNLAAYDPSYTVRTNTVFPGSLQETSLFGSATLHLDENTELTGGVRHIWEIAERKTSTDLLSANYYLGFPIACPAAFQPGTGPICKTRGLTIPQPSSYTSETPTIFNISLSHHFSRDFLVYANTGTSYRPGPSTIGLSGAIATTTDPRYVSLHEHPAEHSRAYEVGVKSTWLDGRARLNAAIFRQKFSNLPIQLAGVAYFNTANSSVANFNFTQSADALVQGFDIDAAVQITHDWSVGLQGSYADGKIKGTLVPCTIPGAVLDSVNLVSLCPGGSSSRQPLWNASLQSEYVRPVAENVDGFLRGLLSYYPENKRIEPGSTFAADSYGLLNLYAGVRSQDGAWEVSIFARNSLNTRKATDISPVQENLNGQLARSFSSLIRPTGYYQSTTTPQREVGISVHYAMGSR